MAYEQYMKHSKNHRKDRFYQQCSGYFGKSLSELEIEDKIHHWIANSKMLMGRLDLAYPD